MQLKSIRLFCDVARTGSFSKAAEENGLSQSAASQVVQQLEDELKVKLVDRSKRPWVLTAEGDCYYRGSRKIVRQYDDLQSQVQSFHQEVAGHVRVASIYSVGLSHMNQYVMDFLQLHPKTKVQMQYEHPDQVYDLVERDVVDVGLVSFPKSSRQISGDSWREEAFVLACSPEHELAKRKSISPGDLDDLDIIGFEQGLRIRQKLDRELGVVGVSVNVTMEFDNTEIIKRAIEGGLGVGLLPQPTIDREVQLGLLAAVPILNPDGQPAFKRPLGIIHRRSRNLPIPAQRFIRGLQGLALNSDPDPSVKAVKSSNGKKHTTNGAKIGATAAPADYALSGAKPPAKKPR